MDEDKVIIIGGGLGGFCLAQGLKKLNVPFRLFERDLSKDWRAQGYRIRINEDGANALKECLSNELWELFEATCATSGDKGARLDGISGEELKGMGPPLGKSWNVDRTTLRSLLMIGLEEDSEFGKELLKFEMSEDEKKVTAFFKDGSSFCGRFLVGSDGIKSPVRKQYLPHHHRYDTESGCIFGKTPITSQLLSQMDQRLANEMCMIRSPSFTLLMESVRFEKDPHETSNGRIPSASDYFYWVMCSKASTFGITTENIRITNEEAKDLSIKLTQEWKPEIKAILQFQDPTQSSVLRIITASPETKEWESTATVTLLGDAVHVMIPAGGVGANTALRDAANLSQVLKNPTTVQSIHSYEKDMIQRSNEAIKNSFRGGKHLFDQKPFEECKIMDNI
eukprot:TRINITY_DN973_c0_g1_i1.p1 TRINITY_DN973_c0_g1~~TRINITY_DN973_c0_g1_i1.p1  ORF type:complete len:406 (+),score=117.41 TRINITY_DN973_c0_g1_i1:36-1220(+)